MSKNTEKKIRIILNQTDFSDLWSKYASLNLLYCNIHLLHYYTELLLEIHWTWWSHVGIKDIYIYIYIWIWMNMFVLSLHWGREIKELSRSSTYSAFITCVYLYATRFWNTLTACLPSTKSIFKCSPTHKHLSLTGLCGKATNFQCHPKGAGISRVFWKFIADTNRGSAFTVESAELRMHHLADRKPRRHCVAIDKLLLNSPAPREQREERWGRGRERGKSASS